MIELGDCLQVLASMPDATVDAVVTDPPYGIRFMGKAWDGEDIASAAARDEQQRHTTGPPSDSRDGRVKGRSRSAFGNPGGYAGTYRIGDNKLTRARPPSMHAGEYDLSPSANHGYQQWCAAWAREALRVLKPGGHLLAFGGTRTYHRLAAGIEDAGFEIRDCLVWLYGSGFPKSLDVSKAIDNAAGATRTEVIGKRPGATEGRTRMPSGAGLKMALRDDKVSDSEPTDLLAPATPDAERWQGWGTALKPAHEPIVLARKPPAGTVAANVLEHGTGALNVDGCRIATEDDLNGGAYSAERQPSTSEWVKHGGTIHSSTGEEFVQPPGRWPANVVLDPEAAAMLDEQAPDTGGGGFCGGRTFDGELYGAPAKAAPKRQTGRVDENGGASRFFYCAKTSSAERNAGLDGFEPGQRPLRISQWEGQTNGSGERMGASEPQRNVHPTVKPIELMRWLVRLVTPPGGLVLDPFAGSGTTGIAAGLERLRFIGIEREAEYVAIARARLAWWAQHPDGMTFVRRWELDDERRARAEAGQLALDLT